MWRQNSFAANLWTTGLDKGESGEVWCRQRQRMNPGNVWSRPCPVPLRRCGDPDGGRVTPPVVHTLWTPTGDAQDPATPTDTTSCQREGFDRRRRSCGK